VREHVSLTKGTMRHDSRPIDSKCKCSTCAGGYSRGYIHHLFKVQSNLVLVVHVYVYVYALHHHIRVGGGSSLQ
jgi:tRNA-guanine family transglycosylase